MDATNLLTTAFWSWVNHKSPRLGAALAYYAVFSLGPLLLIVVVVAGTFFGQQAVATALNSQLSGLIGENGARFLDTMRQGAASASNGKTASIAGVVLLVIAAVGVVAQLKDALNTIWEIDDRRENSIWQLIRTYLISLAGILALGFLLATSLVLSTAFAAFAKLVPGTGAAAQAAELMLSFFVLLLLFAALFKYFPDTDVAWNDVWVGAAATAGLFEIGKLGISWYIGTQGLESTYGAAASLVVLLIWIYYASQILLFGAEVTRAYAMQRGGNIDGGADVVHKR